MNTKSSAFGLVFVLASGLWLCAVPRGVAAKEVCQLGLPVEAVAVQPDQKILVAGGDYQLFSMDPEAGVISTFRGGVWRFHPDGSLDRGFQCAMSAMDCLSLRSDGHILVCGEFLDPTPGRKAKFAMLMPDGSLDESFIPFRNLSNGIPAQPLNWWPFASLYRVALESNGCVIMPPLNDAGIPTAAYARFDDTGRLLPLPAGEFPYSLRGWGLFVKGGENPSAVARKAFDTVPLELCRNALRLPDGGAMLLVQEDSKRHIWRFKRDWERVTNFAARLEFNAFVEHVCYALQPDGKLLVGGTFSKLNGEAFSGVARLELDGTIDNTFRGRTDGEVSAIAIQNDGRIVIGGFFKQVDGVVCHYLARLNPDGSLDHEFQSRFVTPDQTVGYRRLPVVRLSLISAAHAPPATHPRPATGATAAAPPVQTLLISSLKISPSGAAVIEFVGQPDQTYILQARNQLGESEWTNISANTTDATGHGVFQDPGAAKLPMRFYRIASP